MRTTIIMTASAIMIIALAGCGSPASAPEESASPSPAAAASSTSGLQITDAWVKAADSLMSAAFGTFQNTSDQDVTIVGAESSASTMIELHETVADDAGQMVMRVKGDGFVVPAGGSYELAPGANHFMLMGLERPIAAGSTVDFTVSLEDGSTHDFTAPVKEYSGANETYEGDGMDMDMDR